MGRTEDDVSANDTVLTSTWYSDRGSPSATGPQPSNSNTEQLAAWLAARHADTPTVTHLDALGRVFLTESDNGPLDQVNLTGPHRLFQTRIKLDIEGNSLATTDAIGIVTLQQTFDVLKRRIEMISVDAGKRVMVADVAGKALRTWDSRGQTHRQVYDELQRPTRVFVKKGTSERLLLRTVYGEAFADPPSSNPAAPSIAQAQNLRGKPYHVYDCAGLAVNALFDFKGNLLSASRRVAIDYTTEPNWAPSDPFETPDTVLGAVSTLLESEHFDSNTTYDALNRVTSHTTPDLNLTVPTYNRANLLETVTVFLHNGESQAVITNVDYNARGQRVLCEYGNTTRSQYSYDAKTFRLTELLTLRGTTKLQDLVYTYDAVGNVVALLNNADNAPFFSGANVVDGHGFYQYDATYRLIRATGREHPGTQPVATDPPLDSGIPYNIPNVNDLAALRNYTEQYSYDNVGNITQIKHLAGPSNTASWTRNYSYSLNGQPQINNQLQRTSVPGSENDLSLNYTYDPHGSMTSMPHLQVMDWDYADRLRHTRPLSTGTDQNSYFTYDGSGQRLRKVFVASGTITDRIYLGDYEVYRERPATAGSSVTLERQTLHVTDAERRVAMVDTKTRDGGVAVATPTHIWRFQLDNHLGSAMVELDQTGAVITYEEYHPFGSTAFETSNGNAEVSAKRYRYTGKEKDKETGLYYYGARYYAPWLGRWTAADPAGPVDGTCLYQYAKNEPTNLIDRTGHQSSPWGPLVQIGEFADKVNKVVSAVTNSAPVQLASGVLDAATDTVVGLVQGVGDRAVRTGKELAAHPAAYAAAGPLAISAAVTVSEVKYQSHEIRTKAAEQGGGARGYFVATNQQLNPAYGIFEHGDKAIQAYRQGDWHGVGSESTHTAVSTLATVGLAEGVGQLAEGALTRRAPHPTTRPKVAGRAKPEPVLERAPKAESTGNAGQQQPAPQANTKPTNALTRYDPQFAARQILGREPVTPGGRDITPHAAERMVDPGKGRAPMSAEEVDQVLDTADKIRKVSPHPDGDTITVQSTKMPNKPQVVVDAKTGKRIVTVIKNR